MTELRHITAGGLRQHYFECGPADGPPIVLVHGFPLDHTMWREQFAALGERHRVIAPDLRGFGRTDVKPGVVTMERFADDIAALLDAILGGGGGVGGGAVSKARPVTFCGLSMGGYIAWQFWRRHRSRLARLILCDTRAVADQEEVARGRLQMAERVSREGAGFVPDAMFGRLFAPSTREQRPDLLDDIRSVILRTAPEGIAAGQRGMAARPDVTDWLSEIDVPTLVICGEHDLISPPGEMRAIAASIPDARYVEIPGAGHMAPLEAPALVNVALLRFLDVA